MVSPAASPGQRAARRRARGWPPSALASVGLLWAGLAGCSRRANEAGGGEPPGPYASPPSAAPGSATGAAPPIAPRPASAEAPRALPPLTGGPFAPLHVEGFAPAVVSPPSGATGPRPVLVAAHGNYDTPEWQCRIWRATVGDRGFVLCPRGVPRRDSPSRDDTRYEYASGTALEKELDAALAALGREFAGYVDPAAVVYTGFSLGANMGAGIVRRRPAQFPRAVLTEGGSTWAPAAAAAFAKGGGARILWACGQPGCAQASERSAASLARAGAAGRVVFAKRAGHTYGPPVSDQIRAAFAWLVEGDARWASAGDD